MKKSLLAVAVLGAFAGTAAAQSSVVLYGLIDLNVSHQTSGDDHLTGDGDSVTRLDDGGTYTGPGSRWGMRITEDLGGGLKAGVVLESGFQADAGFSLQGGRLFGRQSFISLSSGFGELRLGRQYTLQDETIGMMTPYGNTTVLSAGWGVTNVQTAAISAGTTHPMFIGDQNPRNDNTIMYRSPNFGGFEVHGMVSLGEATTNRAHQVRLNYGAGPLAASVNYAWDDGEEFDNKTLTLAANYNFGAFKILGGYQRAKDLGLDPDGHGSQTTGLTAAGLAVTVDDDGITGAVYEKLDAATLGVLIPIGNFQIGVNYTHTIYDTEDEGDVSIGRAGIGAKYALSKTTYLYATGIMATGDMKEDITQNRWIQLGMGKAF
jgi:predicted porin